MQDRMREMVLKASGKVLETAMRKENCKRPPYCLGILHQPKRPKLNVKAL